MRAAVEAHLDPERPDRLLELTGERGETVFDFFGPPGGAHHDPPEIIGDTHLLRSAD